MKIIKWPNKILKQKSLPVNLPLSKEDEKLANEMINLIKKSQEPNSKIQAGIGLAAVQVGYLKRMIYINVPGNENEERFEEFLINPEVLAIGEMDASLSGGEGCLSVENSADTDGLVHRKNKIIISAYSLLKKKFVRISKTGLHAIVIQHELDHLDGILFFEKINKKNPWKTSDDELLI